MTDHQRAPSVGIEEEFHVVGLDSRRTEPRVEALLDRLEGGEFSRELQRSLIETNTPPCGGLGELRGHIRRLRERLRVAAEPLGLGIVAAGTVPLVGPGGDDVSAGARFEQMRHDYQLLVREQQICSLQVHVDVPDRDTAVQVCRRVAPFLPTLLAVTASSPFWHGQDTGYASYRSILWQRWPTAGPPGAASSAAEYDEMVEALIASGTIGDAGMLYFDVRPSADRSTVELRVSDACPEIDDVMLVAGLFRALVARATDESASGKPLPPVWHEVLRAATWRAARSGLGGDLVDAVAPALVTPALQLGALVQDLRPWLEETGDWDQVSGAADALLLRGGGAAVQRRAFGRRGRLTDVVDDLLARTHGEPAPDRPAVAPDAPALLVGYGAAPHDEAVTGHGAVQPAYGWLFRALDRLGPHGLTDAARRLRTEQQARGVTFGADGQLFPLDLLPRVVSADDWRHLETGVSQRVRALEAFLHDVHGDREIVSDGVLPAGVLNRALGVRGATTAAAVRIAVAGIDLVRDRADRWVVLEDNLRVPSGIGYSIIGRRLLRSVLPELEPPSGVVGLDDVPDRLDRALRSAAGVDGPFALLSAGPADPAYYEHTLLGEAMDMPLATPSQLRVTGDGVHLGGRRLAALYRRIGTGELGDPLRHAARSGAVTLLNALGNGVADDKLVYAYVPAMIRYYLAEEPVLATVPTHPCLDERARAEVLDRLGELVLKPVDGEGGHGVVIGPDAGRDELARVADAVRRDPSRWVAQDVVALSTHPTHAGGVVRPRAVDLRVFAAQGPDGVDVLPSALSRVAPAGSGIVNSGRGGGAKDAWVLR